MDAAPSGMTVYTIRLTTGFARGAALSDPCSGVNVCLVGRDGRAVLHRISPVNDPIESRAHTEEICEVHVPLCHASVRNCVTCHHESRMRSFTTERRSLGSHAGMQLVRLPGRPPAVECLFHARHMSPCRA
jgi:hypothetical protein